MKNETLQNLCWCVLMALLGTIALCGVIFCAATWHIATAAIGYLFMYVYYKDDRYGESVCHYLARVKRAKRINALR